VRAPGRVNLIGEHTDYNDGFVLPLAIDRSLWIALRPRADRRVIVHSLNLRETVDLSLTDFAKSGPAWGEYVRGVAWALRQAGYELRGWEGVIASDVPIASGLSSSAALEMATARAFAALGDWAWEPARMARLGQRAENEWIGVQTGIMDQMASACGKAHHALLIDCRSLDVTPVPLPPGIAVVVMDTGVRRGLVDSAYNERRAQCEAAARFFHVPALRDLGMAEFEARAGDLDEVTRRRARHVVTENLRTLPAVEAMRRGDVIQLGQLMQASHTSLRDDFEVSCRELDVMVEYALRQEGCFGARMTGGGFGGCAVSIVRAGAADAFVQAVAACYRPATGLTPSIYVCAAANGAEVLIHE